MVQAYAAYAPYQFLAYWHELWQDYEARFGSFSTMDPKDYALMTGTVLSASSALAGGQAVLLLQGTFAKGQ